MGKGTVKLCHMDLHLLYRIYIVLLKTKILYISVSYLIEANILRYAHPCQSIGEISFHNSKFFG